MNFALNSAVRSLAIVVAIGVASMDARSQGNRDKGLERSSVTQSERYFLAQSSGAKNADKTAASEAKKGAAARDAKSKGPGEVTLLNCSRRAVNVKTFNSNDDRMWVPTQTNAISSGQALTVKCSTADCKLIIESLKTEPIAGHFVFADGAVKPTNAADLAKGCDHFR